MNNIEAAMAILKNEAVTNGNEVFSALVEALGEYELTEVFDELENQNFDLYESVSACESYIEDVKGRLLNGSISDSAVSELFGISEYDVFEAVKEDQELDALHEAMEGKR